MVSVEYVVVVVEAYVVVGVIDVVVCLEDVVVGAEDDGWQQLEGHPAAADRWQDDPIPR